jgi:hypothetical protein
MDESPTDWNEVEKEFAQKSAGETFTWKIENEIRR